MSRDLPLTGGDLRDLANAIDEIEATALATNKTIRSIQLCIEGDEVTTAWAVRFDESDPEMGWGVIFDDC